ncbi:hypothetical protein C5613_36210 [Rhodococcus opacus]|uniref:Uncharacterized protein n=1 Tax=Rhodococcus opacus TaxID=37919 RepID=A0A2S8IPB5_RHOOP|nr:hypothetical protein C5613_36210 [Rhodococcus opacus]
MPRRGVRPVAIVVLAAISGIGLSVGARIARWQSQISCTETAAREGADRFDPPCGEVGLL